MCGLKRYVMVGEDETIMRMTTIILEEGIKGKKGLMFVRGEGADMAGRDAAAGNPIARWALAARPQPTRARVPLPPGGPRFIV